MTALNIDIAAFTAFVKEFREGFESDLEDGAVERHEFREYLACEMAANHHLWRQAPPAGENSIKAALSTAALRAGLYGATTKQVAFLTDLIDTYATETDRREPCGALLTKAQAARMIEEYKKLAESRI